MMSFCASSTPEVAPFYECPYNSIKTKSWVKNFHKNLICSCYYLTNGTNKGRYIDHLNPVQFQYTPENTLKVFQEFLGLLTETFQKQTHQFPGRFGEIFHFIIGRSWTALSALSLLIIGTGFLNYRHLIHRGNKTFMEIVNLYNREDDNYSGRYEMQE